jgi:hypothetical protein
MSEIDDRQYQSGRAAFVAGSRLRDVISVVLAADAEPAEDVDKKSFSLMLGFVDAAFDRLRGIER